jgi:hypothetical protein
VTHFSCVVSGCLCVCARVRVCRAVFQVVFLHPGLWEEAGDDWRAAAGFVLNSD